MKNAFKNKTVLSLASVLALQAKLKHKKAIITRESGLALFLIVIKYLLRKLLHN
jgi:hypothetical protein